MSQMLSTKDKYVRIYCKYTMSYIYRPQFWCWFCICRPFLLVSGSFSLRCFLFLPMCVNLHRSFLFPHTATCGGRCVGVCVGVAFLRRGFVVNSLCHACIFLDIVVHRAASCRINLIYKLATPPSCTSPAIMCGAYNQKKDRKQILNFQKC